MTRSAKKIEMRRETKTRVNIARKAKKIAKSLRS